MGRAPCCDKVGLKKGRWTAEEDETLTKYIQAHGEGSWRSLPKNAGLLRCGKSCRLRWINYLRADLKRGNITAQEEDLIMQLHRSLGNRWSLIASHLPGRTDNEIKNYWNSYLSRKISSFFTPTNPSLPKSVITPVRPSYKRKVGRVRRSLAKKYNNNESTRQLFGEMPMRNSNDADPQNWAPEQPMATVNENPPMGLALVEQSEEIDKGKSADMLGPFEEMNDQVMGLNYLPECGSGESSGIKNLNEEKENALMGVDSSTVISNDERESGGWGSSCWMGMSFGCSSPMNAACFGFEWDDQDLAFCDEGEYALLWPWEESDTLEVGNLSRG